MNKPSSLIFNSLAIGAAIAAASLVSPLNLRADSLWQDSGPRLMFADKRAAAVGDIITIIVQENNTATKGTSTKSSKTVAANVGITSFLYGPAASGLLTKGGQYPALNYNAQNTFDGGGTINNNETVTAQVAVRVIDVLPNHNLVIEGTRQTAYSGEVTDIVLRGVVRPDDITANNTVLSYNVSDATIKFVSKGSISNPQKKGWFTRAWEKITPF